MVFIQGSKTFLKMTLVMCANIVCSNKQNFQDLKVTGGHSFFAERYKIRVVNVSTQNH